ncbi:hypothetical protein B0T22DRAFT_114594 [Podospora appendiculata]|uniref:Uncharacterized protein n=1 Tax=Podospora appendiculata TaxID=314037 RepID=A0AAE0XLK9_9PEZI|nr:hypothetical protein B0T22DRAFT_114594 [Podospora appendiculata]
MDQLRSWLTAILVGVAAVAYLSLSAKHKRRATLGQRLDDETPAEVKEVWKPDERITHRSRQPFEILYSGSTDGSNGDADVDIIAVHGLGSDVDWSWTWKGGDKPVNWLQDIDMLPAKVPSSRIIAYNYESR